jgi:hypothetical protein
MKNQNLYPAPWSYKITTLVTISFVFLCFFLKTNTFAQSSLTIGTAPASEKLQLEPGEKHEGEIVVWNLSEQTTTYQIYIRGFRQVENQPGTAVMLTDDEESKSLYSAGSWVTVNKSEIELVPHKNEKIFYEINVPEDATKGEYTVIIAFLSDSEEKSLGTTTFTTLSAGTPILIKIGDEFVENAELLKFTTDKNFYEVPTVTFETRIKNIGDSHISPVGEIILTNIFKQEVGSIIFNANGQSILRENTGNYESTWDFGSFLTKDRKLVLGPIDARLVVTYRNFQPGFAPLVGETSFWILPWKYIILALLIIITTMILLKMRRKRKEEPSQLPK